MYLKSTLPVMKQVMQAVCPKSLEERKLEFEVRALAEVSQSVLHSTKHCYYGKYDGALALCYLLQNLLPPLKVATIAARVCQDL
jgi:hypothetical protein